MANANKGNVTGWVGWVYFAGMFMILSGFFQAIAGLAGIFKDQTIYVTNSGTWLVDSTTWGWTQLIVGLIVLFAGLAVMNGRMWGRVIGVLMVSVAAIVNFAFVPVYPFWAILLVVLDFFVLYALVVHGSEAAEILE